MHLRWSFICLSICILLSLLQGNVHVAVKAGQHLVGIENDIDQDTFILGFHIFCSNPSVVHPRVELHNHWSPDDLHVFSCFAMCHDAQLNQSYWSILSKPVWGSRLGSAAEPLELSLFQTSCWSTQRLWNRSMESTQKWVELGNHKYKHKSDQYWLTMFWNWCFPLLLFRPTSSHLHPDKASHLESSRL